MSVRLTDANVIMHILGYYYGSNKHPLAVPASDVIVPRITGGRVVDPFTFSRNIVSSLPSSTTVYDVLTKPRTACL